MLGKDMPLMYHGGKRTIAQVDPSKLNQRDAGFYGPGFYVSENRHYASTYGNKITEFRFKSDARIFNIASIHPVYHPIDAHLQRDIEDNYRAYLVEHGTERVRSNPEKIQQYVDLIRVTVPILGDSGERNNPDFDLHSWLDAVVKYANTNKYDAIRWSAGEIVVMNLDSIEPAKGKDLYNTESTEMRPKFSIGQRVRVIADFPGSKTGWVGTIHGLREEQDAKNGLPIYKIFFDRNAVGEPITNETTMNECWLESADDSPEEPLVSYESTSAPKFVTDQHVRTTDDYIFTPSRTGVIIRALKRTMDNLPVYKVLYDHGHGKNAIDTIGERYLESAEIPKFIPGQRVRVSKRALLSEFEASRALFGKTGIVIRVIPSSYPIRYEILYDDGQKEDAIGEGWLESAEELPEEALVSYETRTGCCRTIDDWLSDRVQQNDGTAITRKEWLVAIKPIFKKQQWHGRGGSTRPVRDEQNTKIGTVTPIDKDAIKKINIEMKRQGFKKKFMLFITPHEFYTVPKMVYDYVTLPTENEYWQMEMAQDNLKRKLESDALPEEALVSYDAMSAMKKRQMKIEKRRKIMEKLKIEEEAIGIVQDHLKRRMESDALPEEPLVSYNSHESEDWHSNTDRYETSEASRKANATMKRNRQKIEDELEDIIYTLADIYNGRNGVDEDKVHSALILMRYMRKAKTGKKRMMWRLEAIGFALHDLELLAIAHMLGYVPTGDATVDYRNKMGAIEVEGDVALPYYAMFPTPEKVRDYWLSLLEANKDLILETPEEALVSYGTDFNKGDSTDKLDFSFGYLLDKYKDAPSYPRRKLGPEPKEGWAEHWSAMRLLGLKELDDEIRRATKYIAKNGQIKRFTSQRMSGIISSLNLKGVSGIPEFHVSDYTDRIVASFAGHPLDKEWNTWMLRTALERGYGLQPREIDSDNHIVIPVISDIPDYPEEPLVSYSAGEDTKIPERYYIAKEDFELTPGGGWSISIKDGTLLHYSENKLWSYNPISKTWKNRHPPTSKTESFNPMLYNNGRRMISTFISKTRKLTQDEIEFKLLIPHNTMTEFKELSDSPEEPLVSYEGEDTYVDFISHNKAVTAVLFGLGALTAFLIIKKMNKN